MPPNYKDPLTPINPLNPMEVMETPAIIENLRDEALALQFIFGNSGGPLYRHMETLPENSEERAAWDCLVDIALRSDERASVLGGYLELLHTAPWTRRLDMWAMDFSLERMLGNLKSDAVHVQRCVEAGFSLRAKIHLFEGGNPSGPVELELVTAIAGGLKRLMAMIPPMAEFPQTLRDYFDGLDRVTRNWR